MPCWGSTFNAMNMIRVLILFSLLPLTLTAEEYTIQLHRPAKVGEQFRVEMTGVESNTMTRKVGDMEDSEEEKWSAKLKGIVTVLKVSKVGGVVQMKLKVDSFTITEGKFTEEASVFSLTLRNWHFGPLPSYSTKI